MVIIRSSDSDSCLSFTVKSALHSSLTDEQPKISDREVPCRKKGRPKKKKDAKNKEGKPVKTKKRKKIVSFFFLFKAAWLCLIPPPVIF